MQSTIHEPDVGSRDNCQATQLTRIYLIERIQALAPGGGDLLPRTAKTKALFAYLCLSQGKPIPRAEIADILWPTSGPTQALDALRHSISELSAIAATCSLERSRRTISMNLSNCWIDVFENPDNPDLLLKDIYGLSPQLDIWILTEQARYENRWYKMINANLANLVAQNAPPLERVFACRQLLNLQPASGTGIRSLMTALLDMDERAEAIREFERYRLFAEANALPISERTSDLYSKISETPATALSQYASIRNKHDSIFLLPPANHQNDIRLRTPPSSLGPQIAILPLTNLFPADDRKYIADGITEDFTETLSRVPGLFVISRLSSAVFANKVRTPQEIGAALGVRYLVSGSVRVFDSRIRLSLELADAEAGRSIWSHRFDEKISDLLDLQSELAHEAVRALAPQLWSAELRRTAHKHLDEYTCYDFLLRAQQAMHSPFRQTFLSAEGFFDAAIKRSPHYAMALAWRAYWHVMRVGQGWSFDRVTEVSMAEMFADQAIDSDPAEAMGFAVRGHAAAYLRKDFDLAFEYLERALQLNPNCARAWLWIANAHGWRCDGKPAVESITQAIDLSPYDPLRFAFCGSAALAYLADHQYERSAEFALRSIRENRSYSAVYKILIPALMLSGQRVEAHRAANSLLRLEPDLTVEDFKRRSPGAGGDTGRLVAECLLAAGIPSQG